jgi:glycosyltransferase involved in cell wall biosynthesis
MSGAMRIGIDVHHLRLDQRGIYYYIWNTLTELSRLGSPHTFAMYLYGPSWMNDPRRLADIHRNLPEASLRHYWDGPSPRLLTNGRAPKDSRLGKWGRRINRRLLQPLYRRVLRFDERHPRTGRALTWPWHDQSPANAVDVFHHPAGLVFPVHPKANVMTIHDLIPLRDPEFNPEATVYFSESYRRAVHMDVIIAVSQFTKTEIMERLEIPASKIHVIPEAANPGCRPIRDVVLLESVLAKYKLQNRMYILYLGAFEKRKNVVRLVEAYAQLRRKAPELVHRLVLAGGGDPTMSAEIHRAVAEQQLSAHVTILGYVPSEDLPIVLSGAELFVFPSLCEGFGLPPLDAMSCGTPVVASNATSLPEVVGEAGVLVNPNSAEAISGAMYRVVSDRGYRDDLSARGLKRSAQFSWKRTAELTVEAYEEAWARWKAAGSNRKSALPPTKYQQKLRQWVIEKTHERIGEGSFADWPVEWP